MQCFQVFFVLALTFSRVCAGVASNDGTAGIGGAGTCSIHSGESTANRHRFPQRHQYGQRRSGLPVGVLPRRRRHLDAALHRPRRHNAFCAALWHAVCGSANQSRLRLVGFQRRQPGGCLSHRPVCRRLLPVAVFQRRALALGESGRRYAGISHSLTPILAISTLTAEPMC